MVKLALLSTRLNHNARVFPSVGYLALTPVRVEGVLRTRLDEDTKPLLVSSISVAVRCIESRIGRLGAFRSNVLADYHQSVWAKPPDDEWGEIGDAEFPFKITVPVDTPGFSNANYSDYRVFWRVDAVIEHIPIFGIGDRQVRSYELPFVRYHTRVPRHIRSPYDPLHQTTHPRLPPVRYHVSTPAGAVGPLDIVSIPLMLHPTEPSMLIRGVSLIVERRIHLQETSGTVPPLPIHPGVPPATPSTSDDHDSDRTSRACNLDDPLHRESAASSASLASLSSCSSSNTSLGANGTTSSLPLIQPVVTNIPAKTITYNITAMSTAGPFMRDPDGVYTKTLSFQWPAAKSRGHWSMGESMETDLAKVSFYIMIKIIVSSPAHGTESLELQERELFIVSTNESERKVAVTKYEEMRLRSKSKSPGRSKLDPLPSPPQSPMTPVPKRLGSSHSDHQSDYRRPAPVFQYDVPKDRPKTSGKGMKRPHTSAGPQDRNRIRVDDFPPRLPFSNHVPQEDAPRRSREQERNPRSSNTLSPPSPTWQRDRPETARPLRTHQSALPLHGRFPNGPTKPVPLNSGRLVSDPLKVMAWEEELRRIETQSRQSSEGMLTVKQKRIPAIARPTTNGTTPSSASDSSTSLDRFVHV